MLNNLSWKKIIAGITVGVAVSGLVIGARSQKALKQVELLGYDFLTRAQVKSGVDPRIAIVGIDDNTLRALNSDKISDRTLQQVLATIAQYQPRVIGVDIIRDIPIGEGRDTLLSYVDSIYQPLEAAVKPIIFPCALPSASKPNGIAPPPVIDPDSAIGFVDLETDAPNMFGGELVRRAFLSSIPVQTATTSSEQFSAASTEYVCNAPFSFGFLTALSYMQAEQAAGSQPSINDIIDLSQINEGTIQVQSVSYTPLQPNIGGYQDLDPSVYQNLIDYHYSQPGEVISLSKVLNQEVSAAQFKDKVVLIGYVTKEDIHQTPFGLRPGVLVHGWIISQILRNVYDNQPLIWSWSEPIEWLWILGWGVVGSVAALAIRPVSLWLGGEILAIAIIGSSCWLLFSQQGWIPLIPPIVSLVGAGLVTRSLLGKLDSFPMVTASPQQDRKSPSTTYVEGITPAASPQSTYVEAQNDPSSTYVENTPDTPQPTYVEEAIAETVEPKPTYVEEDISAQPIQPKPTYVEKEVIIIKPSRPSFIRQDPLIGKSIGDGDRYTLKKLLGQGGMSKVYIASDHKLNNKQVAIKIMTSFFSGDNQYLIKRFEGEVQSLCNLNHPNIIQILDYGTTPPEKPFSGYPFYVMEYFAGTTLQQVLDSKPKLETNIALQIILKVCRGLQEAHQKGIIHRDLKPDNIFLIAGGEVVKVIDFGIAKKIDEESKQQTQLTVEGTFLGTYRYASPEQCRGAEIDSRTDIYSLGVMLYEMLTGQNPYNISQNRTTKADWIASHLREEPLPLRKQAGCEGIPPGLETIVTTCLAKHPSERFATIAELANKLRQYL